MIRKLLLSFIALSFMSFGVALQIKAGIGQGLFNALSLTLSQLLGCDIGTIMNVLNLIFFITYLVFKHFKIEYNDFLQLGAILCNGLLVDFFLSIVLVHFNVNSFILQLILFILALVFASISLGLLLSFNLICFPLEGLCLLIIEKYHYSLSTVRFSFDIIFLSVTILLTWYFKLPWTIREGTLISFILFASVLNKSYTYFSLRFMEVKHV